MNQNLIQFYNNWQTKVNSISGNDLGSIYDRYITLFVIYNSLYNQVPTKLISLNRSVPSRLYDNKMATEIVVQLLEHKNQLSFVSNNKINNDLSSIIDLIDREVFHIKLQNGKSQRNEDLKILTDLRSNNINKKSIAILKVIYYVRCNIFHGSKDFQEYQRQLVEPLTNILTIVISDLYNELTN